MISNLVISRCARLPISGCVLGHTCGVRVLKMDRPAAGGFLSLTGPLAPRVADCPTVHSEHILKER